MNSNDTRSKFGISFSKALLIDEAFRFAVGAFIENVSFVLVYRQTKANMLTLMLHETILII